VEQVQAENIREWQLRPNRKKNVRKEPHNNHLGAVKHENHCPRSEAKKEQSRGQGAQIGKNANRKKKRNAKKQM